MTSHPILMLTQNHVIITHCVYVDRGNLNARPGPTFEQVVDTLTLSTNESAEILTTDQSQSWKVVHLSFLLVTLNSEWGQYKHHIEKLLKLLFQGFQFETQLCSVCCLKYLVIPL